MSRTLDFSKVEKPKFANGKEKSLSPKQLRARARRKARKGKDFSEELTLLYKPIEEWDLEELARGRPRASDGTFSGRPPKWVSREVYEEAMNRFQQVVREGVHANAATALEVLHMLITNDEVDEKGKPIVPPSVRADTSKWLIEHVIGKPTQRVEQDISVKLQAVLAQVMVDPGNPGNMIHPVIPVLASAEDTAEVWDVDGDEDD